MSNNEQSKFFCPHCEEAKPVEELACNDEICISCLETERDLFYLKQED